MSSSRPSRKNAGPIPRARGSGKPAEVLPLFAADRAASPVDDRIHATIHEAVLDHRLPPGTRLGEVALADLFGVTRAVIRKVLARLAHSRLPGNHNVAPASSLGARSPMTPTFSLASFILTPTGR